MDVPFVFQRIVVADRAAAQRAASSSSSSPAHHGEPVFSGPFGLMGSEFWWEPIRRTLAAYFDVDEEKEKDKKVVTYVSSQESSLRLSDADHEELVRALKKMESDYGYEVHVVSSLDYTSDGWKEKMGAIVRSSVSQDLICRMMFSFMVRIFQVTLGVSSGELMDCVYMKSSPRPTLIELFPPGTFVRDQEFAAHAVGVNYIAFWNDRSSFSFLFQCVMLLIVVERQFTLDSLPPVIPPNNQPVPIKVAEIVKSIHAALSA